MDISITQIDGLKFKNSENNIFTIKLQPSGDYVLICETKPKPPITGNTSEYILKIIKNGLWNVIYVPKIIHELWN